MPGNIFLGIQRLSNNNNKKTGEFQVRLFGFFFFLLCGQIFTSTVFVHFFHIIKGTLESFFFLFKASCRPEQHPKLVLARWGRRIALKERGKNRINYSVHQRVLLVRV